MKPHRMLSAGIAAVAALTLGLAGCAGPGTTPNDSPSSTPSDSQSSAPADKTYTIGVAVIVSHPALQAVQDGFEEVLKEQKVNYKLITENAQGEAANATTIASSFHSNPDIDLILAISTPIALAMATAEKDRPILFSAVTDPVKDGIVPSWDKAGTNITGTSDKNPEAKPVALVKEAMPDVKTIGVLYSSSESNSLAQLDDYKTEAAALGITIKPQGITSAAEITAGLAALKGVDAILIPTDNNVVAAISTVVGFGQENKIPVFCADNSTLAKGTVATRGLSYHDLGRRTGEMAVDILVKGVAINTIKPEATTATDLQINTGAAAKFGLTLPDSLVKAASKDVQTTG